MEFYFDIDFIRSLPHINFPHEDDEDVFYDFKRFLARLNSKCYLFLDAELTYEEFNENPFLKLLLNSTVLEYLSYNELGQILKDENSTGFKYFFLNHIDSINSIRSEYGYYCTNSSELLAYWKITCSTRNDLKKFISNTISPFHFYNWNQLTEFILPINSIIISDRYLFTSQADIKNNLFPLLINIGLKPLSSRKIDIVIFGKEYFDLSTKKKINKQYTGNTEFELAFNSLREFLNDKIGAQNYNLVFLRTDSGSIPKDKEFHIRALITNVLVLNPGGSFTIFEKDRLTLKVKAPEFLDLNFFLHSGTRGSNMENLSNLKRAFSLISDKPGEGGTIRVLVENEKKCRLFN